jgi:hypothetical protein
MNRFLQVAQDLKKYHHFPTGQTARATARYASAHQASAPLCEAAQGEFTRFSETVGWLDNELKKATPDAERLRLKRELVRIGVDRLLADLPGYIAQGCCEPHLQTLEQQVRQLPWHAGDPSTQDRDRLIRAIQAQQRRARTDYEHC